MNFNRSSVIRRMAEKLSAILLYMRLFDNSGIPFLGGLPVDDLPEGLYAVGTGIAVVDVVGVFPYVDGQQRVQAVGQGIAGVGLAYYR